MERDWPQRRQERSLLEEMQSAIGPVNSRETAKNAIYFDSNIFKNVW
jgi:hypothetical protein